MEMGRPKEYICLASVLIRVWEGWQSWKLVLLEIASLALRWVLSNGKPLFVLASQQVPECCVVLRHDTAMCYFSCCCAVFYVALLVSVPSIGK